MDHRFGDVPPRAATESPSDTQTGEISPKPDIIRTRCPADSRAAPAAFPREAAMNAPLIAPLIPPRGRSGSREHGRAALHGEFADAELLAHVGAGPGRRQ